MAEAIVETPIPIDGLRATWAQRFYTEAEFMEKEEHVGVSGRILIQDAQNYRALTACLRGENNNYPSAAVTLLDRLRMTEEWARREKQSNPQLAAKYDQEARELQRLLVEYVYEKGNSGSPAFGIGMGMEYLGRLALRLSP